MRLNIGGLVPFTTIDYPGHLAAVVFLQGCSWRCAYCHNPHLIDVHKQGDDDAMLRRFLESRRGLLDGIVFSGGEPVLQSGLVDAIADIKTMGFKVALHTAGANPQRLRQYVSKPDLDWIGLDVKTAFANYAQGTGIEGSGDKVQESLKLVLDSGVDYEVRTTVDPNLFTKDSLFQLAHTLADLGVSHYALQECRAVDGYEMASSVALFDSGLIADISEMFANFTVRHS
ncbi:MAG: anaerobic ribonucleoside-triphosphate reductase activating protein [Gammaproteobacteria bacterium]|nr:anaerobic ribonucleoside-triphosphate reductase activating protein [Gammaproteobacteria bacterium]